MEITEKDIELIDLYLEGNLNDDDHASFLEKVENDPEFRSYVDFQKQVITQIKTDAFESSVKQYLNKKVSKPSIILRPWFISGIAASIIFIAGLFYVLNNDQDLYFSYFEPYPDLVSTRIGNSGNLAMSYYNSQNYIEAINEFNSKESLSELEKLYLGISYLGINQTSKAETVFIQLLDTKQKQQARWYLALNYLAQGNDEKCISILNQIEPGDFNYSKAQKLLKEAN